MTDALRETVAGFDAEWEPGPADAAEPRPPFRPGPSRPRQAGPGLDRPPYGAARRFDRPAPGYVQRRPSGPPNAALTLADGEELVAGRRPVEEAFVARREARRLLVVPQRRMALEKLVLHATNLRIPVVEVEGGSLTALTGFDGHQGIALVVAPRRWASPDDILAVAAQREQAPLVLVLDSLEDPQNVGTLLRTAEASGVHGAIFPTFRQAPLSPAAVKASAGAVEHLRLAPVDDLAEALADLHVRGLRIVGADGDAPLTAREADLRGPIAIVVGSEGRGLGSAVRRRCDLLVRIPMHGRIESLNAAVAGSILLYEAAAQRGSLGERPVSSSQILGTADDAAMDDPASGSAPGAGDAPDLVATDEPDVTPTAAPAAPRKRATRTKAGATSAAAVEPDAAGAPPADEALAPRQPAAPGESRDPASPDSEAPPAEAPAKKPRTRKATAAKATASSATGSRPRRTRVASAPGTPAGDVAATGPDAAADDLLPGGPPVGGTTPDHADEV